MIKFLKKHGLELLILLIITIPSFLRLLNSQYFSMHDDQHVARLFLLDQGLKQGSLYPRWVGTLGFNFGYPLFNFYPPLVYYLAELFHLIGFSLTASIRAVVVVGFFLGALGVFYFVKQKVNRAAGYLSATLYTYFFYHAVVIYVRGALAEFFTLAIIPFVFLTLDNLFKKPSVKSGLLFGLPLALLILTHPLIAFPAIFFIGAFFIFYFFSSKDKLVFFKNFSLGTLSGLGLSAFFWLPSYVERKYTLVDDILTRELANYKIHFVYLKQFWYSAWGYGGSIAGAEDGLTFQLGKIHILVITLSLLSFIIYLFSRKRSVEMIKYFLFSFFLLIFSLFMASNLSEFVWDKIKYLWYLQFPWRFLTFTTFFISVSAGMAVFFLKERIRLWATLLAILIFVSTIFRYEKYFAPAAYINKIDKQLTTFEEIAWRVSKTSFEFTPKGIKTAKTELGTTTIALTKEELKTAPYEVSLISPEAVKIKTVSDLFARKEFEIKAASPFVFRLNTFDFPGWTGYLDDKRIVIDDQNDYKLITVSIPAGAHRLEFIFANTTIRTMANYLSVLSAISIIILWVGAQKGSKRSGRRASRTS